MNGRLWNIGLKTDRAAMDTEVRFLQRLGGQLVLRETLAGATMHADYALLDFCGTRLVLGPTPLFEPALDYQPRPGLTHAVFEVDSLEGAYAQITALGADVLLGPTSITAGFGSRRIAFFRSPGGFIFEVMQVVEDRV